MNADVPGLVPQQTVDLTNCDREPIHIPGAIQPHGMLFALAEPELTIAIASDNAGPWLGVDTGALVGRPLASLIGDAGVAQLRAALAAQPLDDEPLYAVTVTMSAPPAAFDGIVHRHDGLLILELEPRADEQTPAVPDHLIFLQQSIAALQRAPTLLALCQRAAEQVRALTGFDRVMVYRFAADDHGEVIVEEKRDDLESFFGLHYPASDIPVQARALYLRKWLRLIPDITYTPAGLTPPLNPRTDRPLDMSLCTLRSVSPIHIEYLTNMGVGASMSISLVRDNKLWGLIACHHYSPRRLPYDIRTACEFLARVMSLQLMTKEESEGTEEQLRLAQASAQLVEALTGADDPWDILTAQAPRLAQFVDAAGVAICRGRSCTLAGATPPEADVRLLAEWVRARTADGVFATDRLPALYGPATRFSATASGLLALQMTPGQPDAILWFRPEVSQTVTWAGDPTKPVEMTSDGPRLSPRKSFAKWQQEVDGVAVPWARAEIDAVRGLRRGIIGILAHRAGALAQLNAELAASNEELDAFAYIASHDLKEPLRGIHNYAQFVMEDHAEALDEEARARLRTISRLTQRMEALLDSLLYYARVGRAELARQETDLGEALQDALDEVDARIAAAGVVIRIPRPLPLVHGDALRLTEVFTNLLTNAIKYNDKNERWIEIGYRAPAEAARQAPGNGRPAAGATVFYVQDNGIGIAVQHHEAVFQIFRRLHGRDQYGGGTGAGLTIARKIVERHGGRIWLESQPADGTTVCFTLAPGGADEGIDPRSDATAADRRG